MEATTRDQQLMKTAFRNAMIIGLPILLAGVLILTLGGDKFQSAGHIITGMGFGFAGMSLLIATYYLQKIRRAKVFGR